jgi:hypothetical protein
MKDVTNYVRGITPTDIRVSFGEAVSEEIGTGAGKEFFGVADRILARLWLKNLMVVELDYVTDPVGPE